MALADLSPLDLFIRLAAVSSPPGKERGVADLAIGFLGELGLETDEDGAVSLQEIFLPARAVYSEPMSRDEPSRGGLVDLSGHEARPRSPAARRSTARPAV